MMEKQGFDLSQGIWRDSGWQEVEELRRKLESLKELRELVRALGRAGGKGPLRRAPQEVQLSPAPDCAFGLLKVCHIYVQEQRRQREGAAAAGARGGAELGLRVFLRLCF